MPNQVGYISFVIAVIAIFLAVIFFTIQMRTGPTKKNQKITHAKLDDINEMIRRLDPAIADDTKRAIENIFLSILKTKDIPQWQRPEKLQEIATRHQKLLAKFQTIESGDTAVDTLRAQARRMIELGDYDNADELLQEAVDIDRKAIKSQEEKLDNRKLSMSQSLASRAELAGTKLDYEKGIDLYKEALDILPQNQQTIQSVYMNNLASLYYTVANYKDAEPLYNLALAIDEASFGKDHPNVATDLSNLAQLYQDTNRPSEAEPMFKRALAIWEKSLGENHPQVATALNNIAMLYQDTNRLSEAEPLMKRALAIDEASFGKDHPNVATRLNNLALLYRATTRLSEAEPLMKRALAIDEASFGKDHPNVAIRLNNLAQLYYATKRLAKAEPMIRRALKIDEKSFGKDHPNVARDLNTLVGLLKATNRLKEAEPLMKRVIEILLQFTRRTGHPHPHLEDAINNYTDLLTKMGYSKDEVTDRLNRLAPEMFNSK